MNSATPTRDRGHALISAMVLITLLAMLSVGGFRAALLESRIADASRESARAFQQAENLLRLGVRQLVSQHLAAGHPTGISAAWTEGGLPLLATEPEERMNPPAVSTRTLRTSASLAVGRGVAITAPSSHWVQVDATAFNRFGDPAIALRSFVKRGTSQ